MNGPWNDTDTWAVESGWPGSGDTAYIGGILTVQLATFSTDCAKLFMDGGTVDIGSGSLLRTTEELNMSGGGLSGAGTLLNDGIFTRSGTADHMINCTVTNTGTVNHQDAGGLTVGGAFNNAAAAEYYLHGDGGINGGGIFRNFGLLAKTGGTGTSAASTTFHNAGGTLAVSSGRLRLTGSGTFQSGTYFADEDGVLEFAGNSVLTGTLQGTGTGEVRWTAGTWGSGTDATLAISNFCWRGGELNGHVANDGRFSLDASATGTVKHATLDNRALVRHSSGTLRLLAESGGTSTVNNEDGAAWEIVTNGVFLSGGTGWGNTWFNNFGCLAKTGGDGISRLDLDTSAGLAYGGFCNFGGAIEVRSGRLELAAEGVYSNGIYTAAAGAVLHLGGGIDNLGRMTFDAANATNTVWHGGLKNSGLLRQTGGILRIHAQEGGASSVENATGGVWQIAADGAAVFGGTGWGTVTFKNHGSLVKSAGDGPATITLQYSGSGGGGFQNDGDIAVQSGALHIGDRFTHTGGRLAVDEGAALHLPAFTLAGGTLAGGGTLVTPTLTSAGTVAPGASIGRLTVTGNYAQGGSGALAVEICGREPGISHDQLAVSGSASLNGELNVAFAPGFIPALNDGFAILTCASRSGTFSQTHLADDLYEWTIDYSPTAVVLRATAPVLATNGVPAAWLAGFGWTNNFDEAVLGDQDGDGAWTWQEYVMDTCPTNAASFLRIAAISNGPPVTVVFDPASAARDYTLQATTNLVTGPWADVPGQGPRSGAGGQDAMSEASGDPARFYRVKVEVP